MSVNLMNLDGDLATCLQYNEQDGLNEDTITDIVASITGENDGPAWCWILSLTNGKFAALVGGCDYTGWDCQSSASHTLHNTADAAARAGAKIRTYNGQNEQEDLEDLRNQIAKRKPVESRMERME